MTSVTVRSSRSSEWGLAAGPTYPDDQTMRVEAGAVVDEYELSGIGQVVARYTRTVTSDGVNWACMFTVVASGVADLSLVHRLAAPSFAEARRCVRHAIEFLAGRGADPALVPEPVSVGQLPTPRLPWTADPRGNQAPPPEFSSPLKPEPAPLV